MDSFDPDIEAILGQAVQRSLSAPTRPVPTDPRECLLQLVELITFAGQAERPSEAKLRRAESERILERLGDGLGPLI